MEVYQVRVFLEVARNLSFTEAADTLNLTQPAVSAKIKSLETELGTSLFYRLGRKIQLTEVGQFLLEEGPKLIETENQLLKRIEEIKQGKFGTLKIGCTTAIGDGWLPDILFEYRKQHAGIEAQCIVFESVEFLYRALTSGQVDLGISDISFADFSEISAVPLDAIQYSLMVAATHPLAGRPWLSLKELGQYPLAVLPPGTPSRLVFEARLAELGLSFANFAQVDLVETVSLMRTYILQGNYLGFASNLEFKIECQTGMMAAVPLQEFALPGTIFLLSPRRIHQATDANPGNTNRRSRSLNPVQAFTALVQSLTARSPVAYPIHAQTDAWTANLPSAQNSDWAKPPTPARLRSPSPMIRVAPNYRPETISLAIGTQNSTLPTVTGGLLLQRLGLLEHFLPRDGRYSSTTYQITWHDFTSGAPIIDGLHAGTLNIGVLGDYPLLLSAIQPAQSSGKTEATRLVSFVATNPDGSCNAVIVPHKSKLSNMEDLRGRVIAVPFSSSAHGMVMRSLNSINLLHEVRLAGLQHSNPRRPFADLKEVVDGYAHFAPFPDIACRHGKFRYLEGDGSNCLPAFHGVVVNETLADQHPEIVVAYLQALKAAQYWYMATPSAPLLISQWSGLEPEIVLSILRSMNDDQQPGRFFPDMTIRPDWLKLHIAQLSSIPGNEQLNTINLDHWIQYEFLQKAQEWKN